MSTRRDSSAVLASAALVLLVAATFLTSVLAARALPLIGEDDFNVVDWELRHVANKWLYLGGRLVLGKPTSQEEDAAVAQYLELSARVRRLQRSSDGGSQLLDELNSSRSSLENLVEATIEGRITAAIEDAGLTSSFPLFPRARWVFPPVDIEFDEPPRELAISPRERIELVDQRPLRADLSLEEIASVEAAEEQSGRSAIVLALSGVATYPSLVRHEQDYRRLIETAAHEWVHQYLFFKPLGREFAANLDTRTLNETVATIAGEEIAFIALLRDPLDPPFDRPAGDGSAEVSALGSLVLQQLRADVDALLAFGQVEAAEARMEQQRRILEELGIYFRRINQAFFAFRNVYATEAGTTSAIGLKLAALRIRSGSLEAFLGAAASITTEEELDELLASSGGTGR